MELLIALVLALAGCAFEPSVAEGALACGPSCPPGMRCAADGRCYRTPPPDGDTAPPDGADLALVADLSTPRDLNCSCKHCCGK